MPVWPWQAVSSSPSAWEAEVQDSHRLFLCARCGHQVRICTDCDRGNLYCSEACSSACRRGSVREAGRRYQRTPCGARNHARRQQAYRARIRQRVTHQGSGMVVAVAEPSPGEDGRLLRRGPALAGGLDATDDVFPGTACSCDLCGRPVASFARLDFLTTPCRGGWP